MKDWLQHAIDASDLCQSYIDIVSDKIFDLTDEQKETLKIEIEAVEIDGPEEAAAVAVIKWLLNNPIED